MMSDVNNYQGLLVEVKEQIRSAQYAALKAVNQELIAVLDDTVRFPDENPAIGIIICKTKDRTIVEYALRESNKPIGVTTYQIVSTLPQEFQNQLPNPTQIAKLLAGIDGS